MDILLEVSAGDFLDRVSILEIKTERMADAAKRATVSAHLASLAETRAAVMSAADLGSDYAALKGVNEALWEIEDDIRKCEATGDFGAEFIRLARAVYQTNDRRAAIKRVIDDKVGAGFVEEKEYVEYGGAHGD